MAAIAPPPVAAADYRRIASELAACGSLEMNADRAADAKEIAAHLPVGTRVYVNHLPRHSFNDSLAALVALQRAGLEAVPHIAARRIETRFEVQRFLERAAAEAGVTKALVLAGDTTPPRGPYHDGASLLRDGVLAACGIREIGLPGYPEGHPSIPTAKLDAAMDEKLAIAREQGLGTYVLTQFSFAPGRIVEYCSGLARRAPSVPVYVGLAGPTDPIRLVRFAQRCGVSASLRALRSQGFGAVKLITHTDPGEQLVAIARYCAGHATCNVVGVHLFSFGGVAQSAAWLNRALASAG